MIERLYELFYNEFKAQVIPNETFHVDVTLWNDDYEEVYELLTSFFTETGDAIFLDRDMPLEDRPTNVVCMYHSLVKRNIDGSETHMDKESEELVKRLLEDVK